MKTHRGTSTAPRNGADLDSWRDPAHVRWSFQNLGELVPVATIQAGECGAEHTWAVTPSDQVAEIQFAGPARQPTPLADMFTYFETDALVVVHDGAIVYEFYADHYDWRRPHTIFSVSKSLTSALAGIFVGPDGIDVNRTPAEYLPDLKSSAYSDCTIQQLLDMQIAIDFDESYLDRTGQFNRYRMAMQWVPQDPTEPRYSLRSFASSLKRLPEEHHHGEIFRYRSPNSDVLGMLVESVSGQRFAEAFSEHIWIPVGAAANARVTLDHAGGARTGGGILATARDLAVFGELIRNHGAVGTQQLVPEDWVIESLTGGDNEPWAKGDFASIAPDGRYRNKWYNTGNEQNFGIGIHGQYVYVDREARVSIAHFSSHPDPLNDERDPVMVRFLQAISQSFRR